MLKISEVSKNYPLKSQALKPISFELGLGDSLVLKGQNGCGKSTCLKILSGLITKSSGSIEFQKKKILSNIRELNISTGYAPADTETFYPNATMKENLEFFAKLYGVSRKTSSQVILEWAKFFNCEENLNIAFQELSSGNKRRVNLVRAMITTPELILLDEPFSNLDPESAKTFAKKLSIYTKENRSILILATQTNYFDGQENSNVLSLS